MKNVVTGDIGDKMTLIDAQKKFIAGIRDGVKCPCCGRYAKVNKILITKTMVLALKWINEEGEKVGWVHVQETGPDWIKRSNSHAKLIHWGLLERKESDDGKKHSGIYRATLKGKDFLNDSLRVRKYMLIYNHKLLSPTGVGAMMLASDCMSEKFDYEKMVK